MAVVIAWKDEPASAAEKNAQLDVLIDRYDSVQRQLSENAGRGQLPLSGFERLLLRSFLVSALSHLGEPAAHVSQDPQQGTAAQQ
jgi:hypothetical protein